MLYDFYQNLPQHIDPIALTIGFFSVRWYAISYIVGFAVVYGLLLFRIKRDEQPTVIGHQSSVIAKNASKKNDRLHVADYKQLIFDFLLLSFVAALAGGRLGYVLFYDFSHFWAHPLAIISPYDQLSGQYVGIFGMSYHGSLLGVVAALWYFSRKNKLNFWRWADFVVPAIPAGYFFGRIGNFLNGELFGRTTDSPWGMYFAGDAKVLRHPSQLYEALGEGILLFVLLWAMRNRKYQPGTLSVIYVFLYGAVRFAIEFFRKPDAQIGLLGGWLTLGQVFSLAMILIATLFFAKTSKDSFR